MKYNLNNLNNQDFETLVQALSKKILGNGAITFGDGTDGGREASFEGSAPYPSTTESWDGYWVVQAKFKSSVDSAEEKDFNWVETNLTSELKKYITRKNKVRKPDNYLLFTNVILTAKANNGGRDKASELEKELSKKYQIKNIRIISNDDIRDFLNSYRDIATAYAPFILPGDILSKILDFINIDENRKEKITEVVCKFLEVEFKEDIQSKLDHAGKLTSDKVSLEKVFIDLQATEDGLLKLEEPKFIEQIISMGNRILKHSIISNNASDVQSRYVLIAGPGYGKSTLTQFLAQIYRAYFLNDVDSFNIKLKEVFPFIQESNNVIASKPKWVRLPIKVILKDYAGWIKENANNSSMIEYIKFIINKKSLIGGLTNNDIETLFKTLPCLFIFDGLDEVPSSSNRNDVLYQINNFTDILLRRYSSDALIIATSRPQGYSKEFDTDSYRHLYITDLEPNDCKTYLSRLLANIIDNVFDRENKTKTLHQALEHQEISRLMRSPLQASIMAILVNSGGEPPRNKYDLFSEYYNIIFKREKQRGISRILSEKPRLIDEIHNKLGYYLQAVSEKISNPSATISIDKFDELTKEYLRGLGMEEVDVNLTSQDIINVATDRLVFISELEDQKIGFAIRSLQEYFAANFYMHNIRDEEVAKRIRSIDTNSYWSNTLLFSIGYISRNKDYLIDSVESICHELNGSTDDNDSKSLSSIVQLGSWLALEILNEGMLSDYPKLENKFGHLIKPLFIIPFIKKHEELARLPKTIINKWVIKYLSEALEYNITNHTAWLIIVRLIQNGFNCDECLSKYWPSKLDDQVSVIKLFITNSFINEFVINNLITLIKADKISDFIDIITSNETGLLEALSSNINNNDHSINELFKLTFFASLKSYYYNIKYTNVFNNLGIELNEGEIQRHLSQDLLEGGKTELRVQMVEGYYYEIVKPTYKSDNILLIMLEFSEENNINSVSSFLQFLLNPNKNTFKIFNDLLENHDAVYKEFIVKSIFATSSLLSHYYRNNKSFDDNGIDDTIIYLDNLELDNLKDESIILENLKYSSGASLVLDKLFHKINDFIVGYIEKLESQLAYSSFFELFDWVFTHMAEGEITRLKRNDSFQAKYRNSLEAYLTTKTFKSSPQVYSIFYFMTPESISKILLVHKEIYDLKVSVINSRQVEYSGSKIISLDIIKNISDTIKLQIILNNEPIYSSLVQQVIVSIEILKKNNFIHIPFNEILNNNNKNQHKGYKIALMLLDKEYGLTHYQELKRLVFENETLFSYDILKIILFLLKYCANNIYMDQTLVLIYEHISFESSLKGDFHSFLKEYIGSKATDLKI